MGTYVWNTKACNVPLQCNSSHEGPLAESFAAAAYVTSYISKMDKFAKVGWKDVLRELESQLRASAEVYKGMLV